MVIRSLESLPSRYCGILFFFPILLTSPLPFRLCPPSSFPLSFTFFLFFLFLYYSYFSSFLFISSFFSFFFSFFFFSFSFLVSNIYVQENKENSGSISTILLQGIG